MTLKELKQILFAKSERRMGDWREEMRGKEEKQRKSKLEKLAERMLNSYLATDLDEGIAKNLAGKDANAVANRLTDYFQDLIKELKQVYDGYHPNNLHFFPVDDTGYADRQVKEFKHGLDRIVKDTERDVRTSKDSSKKSGWQGRAKPEDNNSVGKLIQSHLGRIPADYKRAYKYLTKLSKSAGSASTRNLINKLEKLSGLRFE